MNHLLLLALSLALSLAAAAAPTAPASPALKAGVFEPPRQAPELMLSGSDGAELKLSRYRGKLVLMSFGFTSCAAVCPVTLATLTQARKLLGPQAESVQVIFVTVDPERDDPQRMKAYLAAFDKSFVGATGKPEALEAVRRSYGVIARKIPHGRRLPVRPFLVDLPDRPRRPSARHDALRPRGQGLRARHQAAAGEVRAEHGSAHVVARRLGCVCPAGAGHAGLGRAGPAGRQPRATSCSRSRPGTYARRMAGNKVEILPDTIRLTLGVKDVLLLRNLDEVPQVFGPALIMPGQSFRLPFEVASTYSFACTAHASGADERDRRARPRGGAWQTLRWRLRQLVRRWASPLAAGR